MNVQASRREGDGEEEEGEVQPGQLLSPHASHPTSRSVQGNKYLIITPLAALVILPLTMHPLLWAEPVLHMLQMIISYHICSLLSNLYTTYFNNVNGQLSLCIPIRNALYFMFCPCFDAYIHVFSILCTHIISTHNTQHTQQSTRGTRAGSGRGSFIGNRPKQPQLNPKGARSKARRGSSSDYSKAEFMKPPPGGG